MIGRTWLLPRPPVLHRSAGAQMNCQNPRLPPSPFKTAAKGQIGGRRHDVERRPLRTISSEAIFQNDTDIAIDHSGTLYRLRITRQGKLILTK